jgi:hypothetical protein
VVASTLIQTVKINFGSAAGQATWNDITTNTTTALLNTLGAASGISLNTSGFTLGNTNGDSPDGGTGYSLPTPVMQSSFSMAGTARAITITGNNGKKYKIIVFGSRNNSGGATGPRLTDYTFAAVTKSHDAFQNKTLVSVFGDPAHIALNGSNQIPGSAIRNAANITNGYLNAMIIEEHSS